MKFTKSMTDQTEAWKKQIGEKSNIRTGWFFL